MQRIRFIAPGPGGVLNDFPEYSDLILALSSSGDSARGGGSVADSVRATLKRRAARRRLMYSWSVAAAAAVAVCAFLVSAVSRDAGESAVTGAAALVASQRADGSWAPARGGELFSVEATALAVLELSGENTDGAAEARELAAEWLRASQNADGTFGENAGGRSLALPAVALMRVYEESGDPRLFDAIDGALCAIRERLAAASAAPGAESQIENAYLAAALATADALGVSNATDAPLRHALRVIGGSSEPSLAEVAAAETFSGKRSALISWLETFRPADA